MEDKLQVMTGCSDRAIWERFTKILESKGIDLTHFLSIEQACKALAQKNVLLVFCESRLIDGTYEDLIVTAKNVRSRARIVVTGLEPDQFDSLGYCRARELGAFDALRGSCGIHDLEWTVICALREEERVRSTVADGSKASQSAPNQIPIFANDCPKAC